MNGNSFSSYGQSYISTLGTGKRMVRSFKNIMQNKTFGIAVTYMVSLLSVSLCVSRYMPQNSQRFYH